MSLKFKVTAKKLKENVHSFTDPLRAQLALLILYFTHLHRKGNESPTTIMHIYHLGVLLFEDGMYSPCGQDISYILQYSY